MFWQDFWPNLAATAAGLALGLPIAFWINRHAVGLGERHRLQSEREGVARALRVLELAIRDNIPRIQRFAACLGRSETLFDTGIDISAWEAVQGTLTSGFGDPDTKHKVAYHFARLGAVVRLNERLIDFSVGADAAVGDNSIPVSAIQTALSQAVTELESEAPQLASTLAATGAALLGQ